MRKQLKKIVSIVLMMMLAINLTACGSSDDSETITFLLWGSSPAEEVAMENTINAFTEKTGIKVKTEVIADKYMDVLKSRFAADNAPDVFYIEGFEAPGLIESDVMADITKDVKDADDFYPDLLNAFKGPDGKQYALPKDYSTLSLYVNEDLIKEAGYTLEDIPTNMTEFMDFAKELQTKLPDGVAAMLTEKDLARHLSGLEAAGATVIGEDGKSLLTQGPEAEAYLKMFVDGHENKYVYDAKTDLGSDWSGAAFGVGKAAMMFEGNWVLSTLETDYKDISYKTFELPTVNGNHHTMAFTVGYGVSKKSDKQESALKFIDFMTNEGQEQWCSESGTLPTRKTVADKMDLEKTTPALTPHIAGAEYATAWSRGNTLPIINTNFGNQFLAAFNGQDTLAQAIKNIDEFSNAEIDKLK